MQRTQSAATGSSNERGDALTRASMGSKVQASHRSRDAALSPQSRRACSRNDPTSPVPVAFACESGGFRERRRRPSTLDPATSHTPRSHVVSAIREITRDRQRVGIRGGIAGRRMHSLGPRRCLLWLRVVGSPSQTHDAKARRVRKRGMVRCPLTWTHAVSEQAVLVLWVLRRGCAIGARARKATATLPVATVNRAG